MRSLIALSFLAVACASSPPAELVSARQVYERARSGPAAQYAPDELAQSRTLLAQAEVQYADAPDSRRVRDFAYAAGRQAERAESLAQGEIAKQEKVRAEADLPATHADIEKRAAAASEASEAAAARARADLAEAKARAAMQSLTRLASVHEESRGTVISLGSAMLFASDGATLLAEASPALDAVADVIGARPDRFVVIESPAEGIGSENYRQWLASGRSAAIRDHLIAHGVPAERIRTSAAMPFASVQIVIQR